MMRSPIGFGLSVLLGCASVSEQPPEEAETAPQPHVYADRDILAVLKAAGTFNRLVQSLEKTGLASRLQEPEAALTLMAPTDTAWAAWEKQSSQEFLKPLLARHVIPQALDMEALSQMASVQAESGETLRIATDSEGATVNGVPLVKTDVEAGNGWIHVMTQVLPAPEQ